MLPREERLTLVRSFIHCDFNFCPIVGITLQSIGRNEDREHYDLYYMYDDFNFTYKDSKTRPGPAFINRSYFKKQLGTKKDVDT